ncbi:MAG: DEAD/DEAH box helicase [Candidatus Bathyarchaeia archaeon]
MEPRVNSSALMILRFDRGTLLVEDDQGKVTRRRASDYSRTVDDLRSVGAEYRDDALRSPPTGHLASRFEARDYQSEAVESWTRAGHRGIVVLPTGAGKTIMAIKAMELLQVATLIVVPTIVLMEQWRETLTEAFRLEVGALGGGESDVKPITVATYDSASLKARDIGDSFSLIVFDEVHHLPSPSNSRAATSYLAPYRLGLTATLGRDEEVISGLEELVGKVIYEKGIEELAGKHLSNYTVKTVNIPLAPDEKEEYDRQFAVYKGFLQRRGIRIRSARDYLLFIKRSGVDPEARRALMGRNTAMDIALNSRNKEEYLRVLLAANPKEKTIIFTRHNKLVYRISRSLLIPAITHQTVREEREEVLDRFRSGVYRRIITSQVLDEGIDVPDASVAVILSGTGSSREFIQRLGRVLRKKEGKQATLYELVSFGTAETRISRRRKEA